MAKPIVKYVSVGVLTALACLVLVWVVGYPLIPSRDGTNQKRRLTLFLLRHIEGRIVTCYEHSDQRELFQTLQRIDTLQSLWARLVECKVNGVPVVDASDRDQDLTDAWGNMFRLEVMAGADKIRLRIISNGPNRVFENGGGDDLYIEIVLDRHGGFAERVKDDENQGR